jgi:hypothetical protein
MVIDSQNAKNQSKDWFYNLVAERESSQPKSTNIHQQPKTPILIEHYKNQVHTSPITFTTTHTKGGG